jgi:NodT family efflux transporter outer membrane factor (OMF) lipoprotein
MGEGDVTGWLADLKSKALENVVREALQNNPKLEVAAARMRAARWRSLRDGAERFPDVATKLGADQEFARAAGLGEWQQTDRYELALNLSWEVDVWGRLRDTQRAAALDAQAAAADFQAARLSLAANTAKAWCNAVEAAQFVELAERTRKNFAQNLESIVSKVNKGVPGVTALDEKLSRANEASARSRLESARQRLDAAKRTLEAAAGRYPSAEITASTTLPQISTAVPAGLPSALLLRRPDLLAAEQRAAAEQKRVQAAWKSLLPTFRLTAAGGSTTQEFSDLLDAKKIVWNIAEGLTQPVFRGGRLLADAKIAEEDRNALAATYADTALQAFREVETALAAETYLNRQISALRDYELQSTEAETMAQRNFDNGLVPFVTVLEAQRRAVDAQIALIQAQNARVQNRLDLYLALGGDF